MKEKGELYDEYMAAYEDFSKTEKLIKKSNNIRCNKLEKSIYLDYMADLINTYNETKSMDKVNELVEAYKKYPKQFARLEFDRIAVFDKNFGSSLFYVGLKCGYDCTSKLEKLKLKRAFIKVTIADRDYLFNPKTVEDRKKYIDMNRYFNKIYKNATTTKVKKYK